MQNMEKSLKMFKQDLNMTRTKAASKPSSEVPGGLGNKTYKYKTLVAC